MFTQILIGVLIILAALGAGGCGVQIGTPDYWREYNESIRGGRVKIASLEHHSEQDRKELNAVIRRVGQ